MFCCFYSEIKFHIYLALHRVTDANVSFYGEGECQPDARIACRVCQQSTDRALVALVQRRRTDRRVVLEGHRQRQRQRQVQDVVDSESRQVAVRRRLHPATGQYRDALLVEVQQL